MLINEYNELKNKFDNDKINLYQNLDSLAISLKENDLFYDEYFDFCEIKDIIKDTFDRDFLKRQDYYFVLANLLAENPDQTNLVGKQKTAIDIGNNPEGPFRFNPDYFVTRFGGMQYYNAGCLTMRFITDIDEEAGKTYVLPRLTQYGEKMALAFLYAQQREILDAFREKFPSGNKWESTD